MVILQILSTFRTYYDAPELKLAPDDSWCICNLIGAANGTSGAERRNAIGPPSDTSRTGLSASPASMH